MWRSASRSRPRRASAVAARAAAVTGVAAALLALAAYSGADSRPAAERQFLGNDVCAGCHYVQHASWAKTAHGKTFAALQPGERKAMKTQLGLDPGRDYTREPACLGCHTTGYGRPGGFVSVVATPPMAGVGCEACHGAGSDYVEQVMRRKYSFAHAEIDELGHIGYVAREHSAGAPGHAGGASGDHGSSHGAHRPSPGGHQTSAHDPDTAEGPLDKYGYNQLGDPPPWAHRHEGQILPVDPAKASYCMQACHSAENPGHSMSRTKDFAGTFAEQVRKGTHRRFGLMFIHW